MKDIAENKILIIHTWGIGDLIMLTCPSSSKDLISLAGTGNSFFFPKSAAIPVNNAPFL